MRLTDIIEDKSVKATIVADFTKLIDKQVSTKSGLSGLALKTAYKVVNGVGPKYVPAAINRLLPSMFTALDPIWIEGVEAGDPVNHLAQHQSRAADMLLGVTDAKIHKADKLVRSSYNKVRKSIKGDVEEAIPGLARIIHTHAQTTSQV